MLTQAQLCHIEASRCVVLVTALEGSTVIASALGEATSAEEAEDRALERLRRRFGTANASPTLHPPQAPPIRATTAKQAKPARSAEPAPSPSPDPAPPSAPSPSAPNASLSSSVTPPTDNNAPRSQSKDDSPSPTDLPIQQTLEPHQHDQAPSEAPTDPDDWSDELAAIDLELQRIGWDRAQERNYLERAFGHGSRHKVTRYSDLVAYIKRLQDLEPGALADQAPVPLRRSELIHQGDQMLKNLQWDPSKARTFLQEQLGANSRQSLSDDQLLAFNIMLENEIVSLKHQTQ